jgi:hypothetical protein
MRHARAILRHAARLTTAVCAVALATGCFPRPLDLQVSSSQDAQPVEGVTIHRHSVTLLSLLPTDSNAVRSDGAGEARIWVPPFNTKLTLLRPGYEPATIGIYSSKTTPGMLAPDGASRMALRFDDLDGKSRRTMRMTPVVFQPVAVRVVDQADGAPIADAEVMATTFLYLPMPGLEDRWGFPDLQSQRTEAGGHASVRHASGFRNVITARKPGYQEARQDFDTAAAGGELTLRLRRLQYKPVVFKAVDDEDERPLPGVVIRLDEQRNGLPPDPNGFVVVTDASGVAPPVPLPNLMPLTIEAECRGYRRHAEGMDWRSLREGEVIKVPLHKKGWFE